MPRTCSYIYDAVLVDSSLVVKILNEPDIAKRPRRRVIERIERLHRKL